MEAARIEYTVRSISVGTFEEPGPAVYWQSRYDEWIRLRLQLVIIQGGGITALVNTALPDDLAALQAEYRQLRTDRNPYHDLMHAGIDPKFMLMSQSGASEKGADVALAIDAMQVGLDGKIDIAVLVTGDADFVPLVRALMKQGIRVMAAYFEYSHGEYNTFINERLLNVCNYALNINEMEKDKDFKARFKGLFRKGDEHKSPEPKTNG